MPHAPAVVRRRSLDVMVEDARLAAVRSYCVLSPHQSDRLSQLSSHAARSLGATHAAVSFVGDVVVRLGGAFGFQSAEFRRTGSFCDAVVRSNAPLLVPNGLADPRFWHHPMVHGAPGLLCYAGAPLLDPGGHALGTVAVYSTEVATFGHAVLDDLSALAGLVRDYLSESRPPGRPAGAVGELTPRVQGWLGVRTLQTDEGKLGRVAGLVVLSIARGSPASLAGLRPTDILQSIDGQDLYAAGDVVTAMSGRTPGSLVAISFRRAGEWRECRAEIVARRTRISGR